MTLKLNDYCGLGWEGREMSDTSYGFTPQPDLSGNNCVQPDENECGRHKNERKYQHIVAGIYLLISNTHVGIVKINWIIWVVIMIGHTDSDRRVGVAP